MGDGDNNQEEKINATDDNPWDEQNWWIRDNFLSKEEKNFLRNLHKKDKESLHRLKRSTLTAN
jgi:hypothetical protein